MRSTVRVVVGKHWGGKYIRDDAKKKYGYREIDIPRSTCNGDTFNEGYLIAEGFIEKGERVFYTVD